MRQISLVQAMAYLDANDVVLESIVAVGKYLMFRRYLSMEWVYAEVA